MDTTTRRARSTHGMPEGFTLVELLVVITIIGILASLIVVAAVGALKTAQQSRIKVELNQISDGIEELKNKHTAYPPNAQTDDTDTAVAEPAATPLSESQVLLDLKRYLQMVAPKHRESDNLLRALAGLPATGADAGNFPNRLPGGMTAGEALVFWLGGFSSDPKYPISGEGGPSYSVAGVSAPDRRKADPITSRTWVFPFAIERLAPRAGDEYFDDSSGRYIEFTAVRNGQSQLRRINFWQYTPSKSQEPYMYFDTSRHPAGVFVSSNELAGTFDPPAATLPTGLGPNGDGLHVHALKRRSDTSQTNVPRIEFVNPEKFQVIHCGIDDAWGVDAFEDMSVHDIGTNTPDDYVLFPTGPFTGDIADTVVNFATQTKLEDAASQ